MSYNLILILVVIVVAGGAYYLGRETSQKKQSETVVTTIDQTANWKTYTNTDFGVILKYDKFYDPGPTEKFVPLKSGQGPFIVTAKFNFDRDSLPRCNTETYEIKPCLNPGKNHFQEKDIQPIMLDGKNAVSFFVVVPNLDEGSDVLHVVQTIEGQPIEIAFSIAGMGGEETFQQILSTFKFAN